MKLAGLLALVVLVVPAAPIARADTARPAAGPEAVRVLPDRVPGREDPEPLRAAEPRPGAGTAPGARPAPVHRAPRAGTPVPRITVAGPVPAVGAPGAPVLAPTGRSRDGERIWLLGGLATVLAAAGAIAVVAARGRREPRHDGRTDV
ncbi:hypothetical protein ACIQ9E_11780 [Streptomyces sp. NPDC094448]|uniref:hypothetical protein n=1 Tax=Streptomyces sp. NPDC094448 TaxID=3366063 RepID=UPI00381B0884